MKPELRVFLDTSALFSAIVSTTGGSREILRLGEAGLLRVTLGPMVLRELDSVLSRKSPRSRSHVALLLDRSGVRVGSEGSLKDLERALAVVRYRPDAQILAEALAAQSDYLVTYDREHLLGNPLVDQLPFPAGTSGEFACEPAAVPAGTAGDFLDWFREYWIRGGGSEG